jgi:hypothetical protein
VASEVIGGAKRGASQSATGKVSEASSGDARGAVLEVD